MYIQPLYDIFPQETGHKTVTSCAMRPWYRRNPNFATGSTRRWQSKVISLKGRLSIMGMSYTNKQSSYPNQRNSYDGVIRCLYIEMGPKTSSLWIGNIFSVSIVNDSLQWRHNGHHGVSNHQSHHCLLNRLFVRRSRKHQSSASLAFVRGIHRGPVNSPHKWPVTRKMFPFDDVIMCYPMAASKAISMTFGSHWCHQFR